MTLRSMVRLVPARRAFGLRFGTPRPYAVMRVRLTSAPSNPASNAASAMPNPEIAGVETTGPNLTNHVPVEVWCWTLVPTAANADETPDGRSLITSTQPRPVASAA